jgi:hypothetical protein
VEVVFGGSVRHFQQYFSYIVAVSLFLVDETGVPGEYPIVLTCACRFENELLT